MPGASTKRGGLFDLFGALRGREPASGLDFLLRTPETLSYGNDTVRQFAAGSQVLADGLLAVITLVGGFSAARTALPVPVDQAYAYLGYI